MSTFPTSYSRSPTLTFSQNSLNALNRTNVSISRLNEQLATGLDILRPSDDPIRSSTISTIDSTPGVYESAAQKPAVRGQLDRDD